jgi:phospholipid transport system transporter-binding protein
MIAFDGNRLALSGPVTLATHLALREESIAYLIDADIEIDLADVTEVDSSALALIFSWQRRAGRHEVALLNPPATLLALADLYGVVDLLCFKANTSG